MEVDSEATADLELDNADDAAAEQYGFHLADPLTLSTGVGISESAPPSRAEHAGYGVGNIDEDAATESEDETKGASAMPPPKAVATRRSRASSPEAMLPQWAQEPTLDDPRLTARQRAKLEKEAGIAEVVQWHEMELPPELQYTWKGKGHKAPNQMTEEEWLKRQEALERRRMRSMRDKREAEETVKAKIRKAVTARFRGKLIAQAGGKEDVSGSDGEGPSAADRSTKEVLIKPGWVKLKHNVAGSSLAWHPVAHHLSYPMAVVAGAYPTDPIDLPLQPTSDDGQQWQVPEESNSTFRPGCKLAVQHNCSHEPAQQQQQQRLLFIDEHGWIVGCVLQRQMLDALEAAACDGRPGQWQSQQTSGSGQVSGHDAIAAVNWSGWQAEVRSVRKTLNNLTGVVVRLQPVVTI